MSSPWDAYLGTPKPSSGSQSSPRTPWQQHLAKSMGVDLDAEGDDLLPEEVAFERAQKRATALGLPNAQGKRSKGLLDYALLPLRVPFGLVYASLTADEDEGWTKQFTDAAWRGEGFGSTDTLKVDDDDSFLEKAGKMAGAFALDVGLDPLTYLTLGTGTAGKIAVTSGAKAAGKKALPEITGEVTKKFGEEAAELGLDAGRAVTRDLAARNLARKPATVKGAVNLAGKSEEEIAELAAERLADVIGTARVAGTGRTVRNNLAAELRSLGLGEVEATDIATRVTRGLRPELRGGLRASVPFTNVGFNLTPGGGAVVDAVGLGKVADRANEVRLGARAALRGPQSILTKTSGVSGPAYSRMLRDLRSDGVEGVLNTRGATSAMDLDGTMASVRVGAEKLSQLTKVAALASEAGTKAINDFGDEEQARKIFNAAFHNFELDEALAGADPNKARRVVESALEMRKAGRDIAAARGIDTTNAPEDLISRFAHPAEVDRRRRTDPGWLRRSGDANPEREATAFMINEVVDESDEVARLVQRRLSAPEINRIMRDSRGHDVVIEDPFAIIELMAKRDASIAESKAIVEELAKRGLVAADPRTIQELPSQAQRTLERAARGAFVPQSQLDQLREDLAGARVRAESTRTAADENTEAATSVRNSAKEKLASQTQDVSNAQRELSKAETEVARAEKALGRVATKKERRALQTARQRMKRASDNLEQAKQELADATGNNPELAASVAAKQAKVDAIAADITRIEAEIGSEMPGRVEKMRNMLIGLDEEQVSAVKRLTDSVANRDARAAEVAAAKQAKAQLQDEVRRAGRTASEVNIKMTNDVSRANNELAQAEAAIRAAESSNDLVMRTIAEVDKVLTDDGDWQKVNQLFTDLAKTLKPTRDSSRINAARDGADAASKLGDILSQRSGFEQNFDGLQVLGRWNEVYTPDPLNGWITKQGIEEALNAMYRFSGNGTALRKALDPIISTYMRFFKTYATVGRGPGYHVRNNLGAMINGVLAGVGATSYRNAGPLVAKMGKITRALEKEVAEGKVPAASFFEELNARLAQELDKPLGGKWGDVTGAEMVRGFLEEGVQYSRTMEALERSTFESLSKTTLTPAERRAVLNPSERNLRAMSEKEGLLLRGTTRLGESRIINDNFLLQKSIWFAEETEIYHRMAAYMEGYARFGGEQRAAGLFAKGVHFDYQDLSETEKALKFIVPFYTWTRYNIPYQLRHIINRPGSFNAVNSVADALQGALGDPDNDVVPDWMANRLGFATNATLPGGGKLGLMIESPQLDILKLLGDEGLNPVDTGELFNSTNPLIKMFFEVGTGRSAQTGQDTTTMEAVLRTLPPVGQAGRLLGIGEGSSERVATSWLNFLGAPTATITDRTLAAEYNQRTQRITPRLRAELEKLLGREPTDSEIRAFYKQLDGQSTGTTTGGGSRWDSYLTGN